MAAKDKLELLKKLSAARTSKSSREVLDEELGYNDENRVYDLVGEEQFQEQRRRELLRDDFVVDDDGQGYVNNGLDEWADTRGDVSSDENDPQQRQASNKKDGRKDLIEMMANAQKSRAVPQQKKVKRVDESAFDDILEEFSVVHTAVKPLARVTSEKRLSGDDGEEISSKRIKSDTAMAAIDSSPTLSRQARALPAVNSLASDDADIHTSPIAATTRSSPLKTEVNKLDMLLDNEDSEDDEVYLGRRAIRSAAASRHVNFGAKFKSVSSPIGAKPTDLPHSDPDLQPMTSPLKGSETPSYDNFNNKYSKEDIVDQATDSFSMFWLDYTELETSLLLFGKIKTLNGKHISAMVQVAGIYRELYFLPREGKTALEVHEEIIPLLMDKYGLSTIRAKPEKKMYAFELADIPKEAEYLKVLLPYETPKCKNVVIPSDLCGDTFCHVFGGNSSIFESFVIQRRILGPCWLSIKQGDFNEIKNSSHCDSEVFISIPQNISPHQERLPAPELKCVSLSVQTVMNVKDNKQEIVSISMCYYNDLPQDTPIEENLKPSDIITLVRPVKGSSFPPGLNVLSRKELQGTVRTFNSEKVLLNCFCAMMKRSDPDVLIGHRLENISLDVLCHRALQLRIPTFSSFGRRLRRSWPERFGKNNASMAQFYIRDIFSGRLLCDISNEMGQSLTPKCQSWELGEMYQVVCQREYKPLEINFNDSRYHEDANFLVLALREAITNSSFSAEIAFRIQILSLTKQLTNLAGNSWGHTLGGTRAGRNEFILLHEFYRNNYILPDKESRQMRSARQQQNVDTPDGDVATDSRNSNKKAKYQGGLVFDPDKGLHKNYILVMDFNSLYPSIIQEFNICFTTVERNPHDIDELPQVPTEAKPGVLPRLLANLVERRREVKKLMNAETDAHKKAECDIRQQALKLTANSMYGCLGYVNSRFYAKPLAMLVTNKGREILMNTRQLAESLGLAVVYGDTDSVMIDTGCDNYREALSIGENFKKLVNERYRLLEIDIDNVFKKLLLHAKKKYAALNVSFDKAGNEITSLEVKGLDMRRREYCPLSKEVSTQVLNTILSDQDSESALENVYDYMETIKSKIENNEIRADKFKINTRLSKDPKSYPNGKTMPAVQVALKMRAVGRVVNAGTVITFVVTKGTDESEQSNPADRARPLHEVMNKANGLVPDPMYYLEKQIFAPVERLLQKIESFDVVRLGNALGIDGRRFINNVQDSTSNRSELQPLESTISDMERFKDATAMRVTCPSCQAKFPFGGIVASNHYQFTYSGLQCKACNHIFAPLQLTSQLEFAIRAHISLFYAAWMVCDDPTCGTVTRQLSVFGKRCLNEACTGVMHYRYSDKQLYNQLLYFDSLFDVTKTKNRDLKPLYLPGDADMPTEPLSASQVAALAEQNRDLLELNRGVVQKYLSQCGRRYVDMGEIFDFMLQ
ncbi:FAER381Cp [Eremothecium gossypii FDAG1]|nr:FAER381Cp [Eremothecium gossypii FDAG1]